MVLSENRVEVMNEAELRVEVTSLREALKKQQEEFPVIMQEALKKQQEEFQVIMQKAIKEAVVQERLRCEYEQLVIERLSFQNRIGPCSTNLGPMRLW